MCKEAAEARIGGGIETLFFSVRRLLKSPTRRPVARTPLVWGRGAYNASFARNERAPELQAPPSNSTLCYPGPLPRRGIFTLFLLLLLFRGSFVVSTFAPALRLFCGRYSRSCVCLLRFLCALYGTPTASPHGCVLAPGSKHRCRTELCVAYYSRLQPKREQLNQKREAG